jgi:phospholipid transport system substrate-binding protein
VLGKHWRKAKADQRVAFTNEFKSLLVRTYSNALLEYADQTIKYLPFRDSQDAGDVTVRSEIEQPGGFPVPINYRLYLKAGEWKVYDVYIDDISLIANYRSSFSREIRKIGIDKLIQKLADKNK